MAGTGWGRGEEEHVQEGAMRRRPMIDGEFLFVSVFLL